MTQAGQVYKSAKSRRYVKIEQVRSTGNMGIGYALARPCGPRGRTHVHPILGDTPITIHLLPDGTMPPGYVRVH